jgi:hypothetical protein
MDSWGPWTTRRRENSAESNKWEDPPCAPAQPLCYCRIAAPSCEWPRDRSRTPRPRARSRDTHSGGDRLLPHTHGRVPSAVLLSEIEPVSRVSSEA